MLLGVLLGMSGGMFPCEKKKNHQSHAFSILINNLKKSQRVCVFGQIFLYPSLQEKEFLVESLVPLMPSLGERSQKVSN